MVAPSLHPLHGRIRSREHPSEVDAEARDSQVHALPCSFLEEALKLGMLAGDAAPSLSSRCRHRRRNKSLHHLPRARLLVPSPRIMLSRSMACPPPSLLPGCEVAEMCLVRCYLTSALGSRASSANGAGKVRDWRFLLANSQSRRLFSYQSKNNFLKEKKEVPKGDGSNKSESKVGNKTIETIKSTTSM